MLRCCMCAWLVWGLGVVLLGGAFGAWAAPALEAYGRLPGVELMRMSPSGERIAFIAVIGDKRRLAVLGADDQPVYATEVGSTKVRDLQWAGDDHLLATVSITFSRPVEFRNDFELFGTLDVAVTKRRSKTIFAGNKGLVQATFGYFGDALAGGRRFAYFGGIDYERDFAASYVLGHTWRSLFGVDLETGKAALIDKGSELGHDWVLTPAGEVAAHSEYEERSGAWRLYAGRNAARPLLQRKDPQGDIALAGLGRRPGTVLVADNSGDADRLTEVSIADARTEDLFVDQDTDEYWFDPDSKQLLGAATPGEPRAIFFDPRLQARYNGTRKAFPGLQMRLVSFSRNLDRLIVFTDGGDDSGTYWRVNIATGQAEPIASAYPQIRQADVGPTSLFQYKAGDGLPIEAVLTLPPGRKPERLPLVVMPHGGPIGVRDQIGFDWMAQAFAGAGYAVLQPNYRGSSGYGRAFRDAGYGQWGRLMQSDLSDGVRALAAAGIADPGRVCIMGASYGGYAALAGVSLQKGVYRCAVSVSGPSDLTAFFAWEVKRHGYHSSSTRYWRRAIGDSGAALRSISPLEHADQIDAPVLLVHGLDDTVVPIEQSRLMESALRRAGKPVTLVTLKGEDHWLSREDTRLAMLQASLDFVREHNPPR